MNRQLSRVLLVLFVALVGGAAVVGAQPKPGSNASPPSAQQKPPAQSAVAPLSAVGSAFTYQGRLSASGSPANGQYDLQFTLYDAASGGNQVGSPVVVISQTVGDGLFTVQLDFGSSAFDGSTRWLELAVRQSGGG